VIDFKNWFKKPKQPSEIDLAIEKLKRFDSEKYRNAYSSDLSIVQIMVYENTIDADIKLLDTVISSLLADTLIPAYRLPRTIKRVYLRNFLIDDNGLFIDIVDSFSRWTSLMARLLEVYQDLEREDRKSFTTEKNLLQTQHLVTNILYLSKEVL